MKKENGWKIAVTAAVFLVLGVIVTGKLMNADSQRKSGAEPVELSFFLRKRETIHIFENIIKDFNDSQDEIVVRMVVVPNPEVELEMRAINGDFPDIVELIGSQSSNVSQYVRGGYLAELSDAEFMGKVEEEYKEALLVDGKIYIIPLSVNFRGLFLNMDLMEEGGYKIPDSYENLLNIMEDIKIKGGLPMIFPDMDVWTIHQGWDAIDTVERGSQKEIYQMAAEGRRKLWEDAGFVNSLEKYINLRTYGQEHSWETSYDEAIRRFAEGESYMFLQGNWAYSAIKKQNPDINLVFIPFPVDQGKETKIVVKLDASIGISAACEHPKEVGIFLDYLLSKDVMSYYAETAGAYSCIKGRNEELSYAKMFEEKLAENGVVLELMSMPESVSDVKDEGLFRLIVGQDADYTVQNFLMELDEAVETRNVEFLDAAEWRVTE